MKVLKIIEKILFTIAIVIASVAISLSVLIDEGAGYPGLVTASATLLAFSATTLLVLLVVGGLLRFTKSEVASRIGDAFTIAVFAILFGLGLQARVTGITITLAFVSSVVYAVSAILRFVVFIIVKTKNDAGAKTDPDKDPRIQLVLKWKTLLDEKIISAEEFETKRKEILGLKEPKAK